MKLQLDTNAVLHLFPEGSEARLDLQSADLIKQAEDHLDNYKENLLNYVLEQEPEILQELLTKLISRKENGTN